MDTLQYILDKVPDGDLRRHLMSRANKSAQDISCRIGIEGEVHTLSVFSDCGLDLTPSGIKQAMPDYSVGSSYIEVTKPRVRDQDTYEYLLSRSHETETDRALFYDHVQADITQPLYKKMFGQLTRWEAVSRFKRSSIYLLVDLSDFDSIDFDSSRIMHDILYGRCGTSGIDLESRFRWGEAPTNAAYLKAFVLSRLAGVLTIASNDAISFYSNPHSDADLSLLDKLPIQHRYDP